MIDAQFGKPASSAEYNKVTANVRDLDSRTTVLETNQGTRGARDKVYTEIQTLRDIALNTTTGNARLGERVTAVETRTTDTVTGNSALNTRATALETNQGVRGSNGTIYAEINSLKAGGGSSFRPTVATDTTLYGDIISSRTRAECWWGESIGNATLTAQATRSPKAFAATALRFCVPTAGAGGGTFELKLYTGTTLTALTERTSWTGSGAMLTTAGLKQLGFNSIAIAELDYVAIAILVTGWSTSPKFSSTATGTGAQLLIGDGSAYSVFKSGQASPIPGTLNMLDNSWTRANQQFWFALL
ncbi:hypothetical protein ACFQ1S_03800 [Kibdelosporangium lantanae]|uniref:Uncharacterized protein n=1 Tax=Kibdelosporangium lantanae TaxID=1497396 RepID=A0ABW3M278_9PSEU